MKKHFLLAFLLLATLVVNAQDLLVGTYNIRMAQNNTDVKSHNDWNNRYKHMCSLIAFMSPDIFGSQEVYKYQLDDMLTQLPGYASIGVGRDDGKEAGEYSPIFYKTSRFKLLDQGHFWLSETPDKPGLGWDAACVRICTWGYFKDLKTKHKLYFFNTHMDHVGVTARREGARLITRKMQELMKKGETVILTGDFNVDQNSEAYRTFLESGILKDSYDSAAQRFAENGTFNAFNPDLFTKSRIDHIFVSKSFKVDNYGVFTDCYWMPKADAKSEKGENAPQEINFTPYERHTLSDHYPVYVKLTY